MDAHETLNLIISFTVFGLVLSIWCIGVLLWLSRYLLKLKGVRKRLGIAGTGQGDSETLRLWRDMQIQQAPQQTSENERLTVKERLKQWVQGAGWKVPFSSVLLGVGAAAVAGFLVFYSLFAGIWLAAGGVLLTLFLFMQYTQKRILKQTNLFERQLLDALGVASRALRAGHPLVGAFQLIGEEISDPVGGMFRRIYQEQAFGGELSKSLQRVVKEKRNTELKLFSTAVIVQMHSGGNLADLMDSLATVIRSRIWLNKRIRVLTAQTQFSKMVLIAMPVLMFFVLNAINPEYMNPLYTTQVGHFLLGLMAISLMMGSWMMNKLAQIDI